MRSYNEWKFCFPESDNTGRFFFFIPINTKINFGGQAVEVSCDFTVRVKSFGIAQIVYQFRELTCHFIRIRRFFILVLPPFINVLLSK